MAGVIRNRKDGCGCSVCRAKEENVGKRRCCHVLDHAEIKVRHEKGANFIDISGQVDDNDTSFSIKATENNIKTYITSLSNGLSKKDKKNILDALKEM
jgi:hypothetical protein